MSLVATPNDLVAALLDAAVKGTIVLAAAAGVTSLMRRAAAATRHLVWSAAVAGVLALPALSLVAPRWALPVLPATPVAATPPIVAPDEAPAAEPTSRPVASTRPVTARALPPADAPAVHVAVPRTFAWPSLSPAAWAVVVWAFGALVVLARLVFGTAGITRLARRAALPDDPAWLALLQRLSHELDIRRPVTLRVGGSGTMPVTWGVVYPVVLLPADATTWTAERRRAVLLHELAHVERFDALTHVISQLALAVFWFHPLVVLAARRLRAERERACDDLVLAVGTRATTYAGDLLELVQTLGTTATAGAALAMARRSEFEGRLLAILDPAVPRARTSRRATALACTVVALAVVPLAAARPTPRPAATPATPITPTAPVAGGAPVAPTPTVPAPPTAPARPATPLAAAVGGLASRVATLATALQSCRTQDGQHISRHDDGYSSRTLIADRDHCVQIAVVGRVQFTDDDADVASLSPGGSLDIAETRGGVTRQLSVRERAGRLVRTFFVDGAERSLAEGASWLQSIVPMLARESTVGVEERVARIRRQRGVDGVLEAVRTISSDGVKRRWIEALLAGPALTDDELRRTADATRSMASDGDRAAVLRLLAGGRTPRPVAVLAAAADAARGLASDGDKTRVLMDLAPRAGESAELRASILAGANTIASDGDRARLLNALLAANADDATRLGVLRSARGIASDGDRARVLTNAIPADGLASEALRTAYFGAADEIASDGEHARVLLAALQTRALAPSTTTAVIRSARRIASDHNKSDVLLAVARLPRALDDAPVRDAFFDALRTVSSGSEYRRVMELVTR